tara:strand:+ start:15487 stop:16605 length:1119 start_codon:yes stop_codon:yes gene_type:complete
MIRFNETYKSKNSNKYLKELIEKNSFSSNYFREKCINYIKNEFGYDHFLLTHSATAALEMAGMLLRMDNKFSESKVYMPSYTFSSTANAFLRSGFKIKFLDIDINSMMLEIKNLNLKPTDVLVPVHYAGSYFNFESYFKINNKKITVVEDAAQAFGVKYKGRWAGSYGRFSCFSFHPTKNIHAGFGGMILFKNKSDYLSALSLYERGTDRSKVILGQKKKYEWVSEGSSFELNELSSAVLLSQLEDMNKIIKIRKNIYEKYFESLEKLIDSEIIKVQDIPNEVTPNYHSFYILLKENNKSLMNYLYEKKIQSYIGYSPLHNSKYGKTNKLNQKLKNTEYVQNKLIRLPSHPNLKPSDVNYITSSIKSYYKNK